MPRVSHWFFAVAVLYGLIGMVWGMYMGATHDHALYPAHAHWLLLGWVTNALYGAYFGIAGASTRLPWIVFAMANVGALLLNIALALVLKFGEQPIYIMPVLAGEVLTVGGMLVFAYGVWRNALRR